MSQLNQLRLEAGGLLPAKTKIKDDGATETVVARSYSHPALGDRPVIRLASDRLGKAQDLAMEYLGFDAPDVSAPVAIQHRKSLGFAAWALINDPGNAQYALDLVKRMKAAAHKAKSKPGHAWEAYDELSKELGRSAAHFLPPFWEEAGRAYKELGNQTYAGRALNKSLQAERVHALESDRGRRRDVILEFVLAGCLAGKALTDYSKDLSEQYPPEEAFAVFRDLCVRRTRGGMAPWAALPKDFVKMAKAAGLQGDQELEGWLEEIIDAPAMGRAANQFWKACSKHCKKLVERNSAFAIAILRHTRPTEFYYLDKFLAKLELIQSWGILPFLTEDGYQDAPPLGEPIADWLARILHVAVPVPDEILDLMQVLLPRLKSEGHPVPLGTHKSHVGRQVDIDVLETLLANEVPVERGEHLHISFQGWLSADREHTLRNQDLLATPKDDRFRAAVLESLPEAIQCRGGEGGGYQRRFEQLPFPEAAGGRPGIVGLWHEVSQKTAASLEGNAYQDFHRAYSELQVSMWPETLQLFPDVKERIEAVDASAMLQATLQLGGPAEFVHEPFEAACEEFGIDLSDENQEWTVEFYYPDIIISNNAHAHWIRAEGETQKLELRLPKGHDVVSVVPCGEDVLVVHRENYNKQQCHWLSKPKDIFDFQSDDSYYYYSNSGVRFGHPLPDGSVFFGKSRVVPGERQAVTFESYFNDNDRCWRVHRNEDELVLKEVDVETGKLTRASVPAWFEVDRGTVDFVNSSLFPATPASKNSPLGIKDGLHGWKTVRREDKSWRVDGIDGRSAEGDGEELSAPSALLTQPTTDQYLQIRSDYGDLAVCSADGKNHSLSYALVGEARGPGTPALPLEYWNLFSIRHERSSKVLRKISLEQSAALLQAAGADREASGVRDAPVVKRRVARFATRAVRKKRASPSTDSKAAEQTRAAVSTLLPGAPESLLNQLAEIVQMAEATAHRFAVLREKLLTGEGEAKGGGAELQRHNIHARTWSLLNMEYYSHGTDSFSVAANLQETIAFFRGETEPGQLTPSSWHWFSMLDNLFLRCWQTYWKTLFAKQETPSLDWLDWLEFWRDSGITELPGQFAIMEGYPQGSKSGNRYDVDITGGESFSMRQGDDAFIFIAHAGWNNTPYRILRYSTAAKPGKPDGYSTLNLRKIKLDFDADKINKFVETVKGTAEPPIPSREQATALCDELGCSVAELALVWMAGEGLASYEHNFMPAELRKAWNLKVTEANDAKQSLSNVDDETLAEIFTSVVKQGPVVPFLEDPSAVLQNLAKAWGKKMGKRLALNAELQKKLAKMSNSSRWHRASDQALLDAASDPQGHELLDIRDMEIRQDKAHNRMTFEVAVAGKGNSEDFLEASQLVSLVQLIALVHAETPYGDPVRKSMPPLLKQLAKVLSSPKTMLTLHDLHFYSEKKTAAIFMKKLGKVKEDKAGVLHYDNGLIVAKAGSGEYSNGLVALRPGKLKSQAHYAEALGVTTMDTGSDYGSTYESALYAAVVVRAKPFQGLGKSMLRKGVPDGAWPQNPLHHSQEVIGHVAKKWKLEEDSAVLYLQLLALPDPTTSNLKKWNGWTPARIKKATAPLLKAKLVMEAKRARAGRTVFLPGEWLELKSPWLPVEAWKLASYVDLEFEVPSQLPFGGPLVLRPFDELFAHVWGRVQSGDKPQYAKVAKKASKKKAAKTK